MLEMLGSDRCVENLVNELSKSGAFSSTQVEKWTTENQHFSSNEIVDGVEGLIGEL